MTGLTVLDLREESREIKDDESGKFDEFLECYEQALSCLKVKLSKPSAGS